MSYWSSHDCNKNEKYICYWNVGLLSKYTHQASWTFLWIQYIGLFPFYLKLMAYLDPQMNHNTVVLYIKTIINKRDFDTDSFLIPKSKCRVKHTCTIADAFDLIKVSIRMNKNLVYDFFGNRLHFQNKFKHDSNVSQGQLARLLKLHSCYLRF